MRLQHKLALGLFIAALLPLLSLVAGVYIYNQSQVSRITEVSQWQAQSVLANLDDGLKYAENEISSWVLSSNLAEAAIAARQRSPAELLAAWQDHQYLHNPVASFLQQLNALGPGQYKEIFLTDARGYVIASTNPTSDFDQGPADDPPDGEAWWAAARAENRHIGEPVFDDSVGAFSIEISLALLADGEFIGVLKAIFNLESALEVTSLKGRAHSRSSHAVLVDRTGKVLAASAQYRSVVANGGTSISDLQVFDLMTRGESGSTIEVLPWVGQAFVTTVPSSDHSHASRRGWNTLIITPLEEALVPVREVQKMSLVFLLFILSALGFLTFAVSRKLSRPLSDIAATVAQIDGGRLDIQVPHQNHRNEVGTLAANINRMTDRLRAYERLNIHRIQQLNCELEAANAALHKLASRDALTGLWNARIFHERLGQEIRRCERSGKHISLMLIDIDHFKLVNDTYGHQAGDAVLRRMGELLHAFSRETDLPARYGGEELALILTETDQIGATRLAEKIRGLIEQTTVETDVGQIEVTASIGVAQDEYVEGMKDRKDYLIKRADEALYRAKKNGRNRVEVADEESVSQNGK